MISASDLEAIRRIAEEVAVREGCVLYDLEFQDGPGRTLRVYIDREPGGVSLDDCVNVSKGLNLRLDVEDIVPGGAYELEVSSPGLDRRLTQLWHYTKALGKTLQIRYRSTDKGMRTVEGELAAVDGGQITLKNARESMAIDFSTIERGRIIPRELFAKKPAPGKKKG